MRHLASLSLLTAFAALPAQSTLDLLVADYEKQREEELLAAGKRHYQLSWSIRDSGLIPQSTWQAIRAVELSDGKHPSATAWLRIVRNYGEEFWRKRKKTPSKEGLARYDKDAAAAELANRKGQIKLAKLAQKARLTERAQEHWRTALQLGARLELRERGGRIDGEAVGDEVVQWLQQQASAVNGATARFEPAGAKAPRVANVREVASAQVVVRTDLPGDAAERLHALAVAQWPLLQQRLAGAPVRPLGLFVFGKRADYDAYLTACGHGAAAGGSGLCDYGTFQTLVSAEGLAPEDVDALVLHELAHLFFFGSAPVAMPDWYAEGFAESFGGQGTFTWDGKQLTIGGVMRRDRIDALKQAPMTLAELMAGSAEQLLAKDHPAAMRFYAQCWALQRWFLQPGNPFRARFLAWEDVCRGAMPGVSSTARFGDPAPATAAFVKEFGKELPAIERAFRDWLQTL